MGGKSVLTWAQYEELLDPLTKELSDAARWIQETRQRLIVIFEGRDTAGKGGSIDMIARNLNPRQCHVAALPAPSAREQGQWYFQRYTQHFPAKGEITLFDRSWYNRAGVERVMGYCSPQETEAFLQQVPEFERQLVEDGFLLYKYWLCCDQAMQEERFEARPLPGLYRGARAHAGGDPHALGAVDAGRLQRPECRPPDPAARPARPPARHQAALSGDAMARSAPRAAQGAVRRPEADPQHAGHHRQGGVRAGIKGTVTVMAVTVMEGIKCTVTVMHRNGWTRMGLERIWRKGLERSPNLLAPRWWAPRP
jgi:hypothetical protein